MSVRHDDSEWQVEHITIRVTLEAGELATPEQWAAVGKLGRRSDLRVWRGGFDLPDGYLMFTDQLGITGGIAPDGQVST